LIRLELFEGIYMMDDNKKTVLKI